MSTGSNVRILAVSAAILCSVGAGSNLSLSHVPAVKVIPMGRHHHRYPLIRVGDRNGAATSTNWSGYAVTAANGAVTDVKGSWVVPTATCSAALNDRAGYSAMWVGIDGDNSGTVEQTGTDSDCVGPDGIRRSTPTYYAWYEFYPGPSYFVQFANGSVQPGDVMNAEVVYTGQSSNGRRGNGPTFTVTITDTTKGLTFSTSSVVAAAKQTSAEWIAEAPCCQLGGGVLPLADFGSVSFMGNLATINGTTNPISAFGNNVQQINMVSSSSSSTVKAQTSALSPNSDFSVTWVNAGP